MMAAAGGALSQAPSLVTEAEVAESMAAGGMLTPRSRMPVEAPRIELVSPDVRVPVSVPTKIELRFVGTTPGEPRPETFRVLYGALRIDITERLLGVAKVTKDGISVPQAVLPAGRHQLALSVKDSLGREGQQVISFQVQ